MSKKKEPYFPEKVDRIKILLTQGKTFSEIGQDVGLTRAGCHYYYRRWIKEDWDRNRIQPAA